MSTNNTDQDKKKSEWDNREVGALWLNTGKTNNKYYSGSLTINKGTSEEKKLKVLVFKNKYKEEGSNKPDLVVYEDDRPPKEGNASTAPQQAEEEEQLI